MSPPLALDAVLQPARGETVQSDLHPALLAKLSEKCPAHVQTLNGRITDQRVQTATSRNHFIDDFRQSIMISHIHCEAAKTLMLEIRFFAA